MKVTRRPLVMDADPPMQHFPFYTVRYKDREWQVEKSVFLELYQLEAVGKAAPSEGEG